MSWPAEPVVAMAYLDQLERAGGIDDATRSDLAATLERAGEALDTGAKDKQLARKLDTMAKAVDGSSLAGVLEGVADRLR